jgi:predicted nuclease with TOPRIM domain
MSRDQRHEIYDTLSDAWNRATSRIVEIKEEKRRKYEEWRERMESNIERWENNIEKAEEYISRLEEQIDRLEEEEANARTDEYARIFYYHLFLFSIQFNCSFDLLVCCFTW